MKKYRNNLPQTNGRLFLTDGGLETTLVFHEGIELPHFAAFDLLRTLQGTKTIRDYYERYIAIARSCGAGFLLESPSWRANPDWGTKLGYSREALAEVNRACIALMEELRAAHETAAMPMPISGNIGPRGDGYDPGTVMSPDEAERYHSWQVGLFAESAADLVSAFTMTNTNEAIGVARAAKAAGMPCVISFTLETDGRLPTGESLTDAVAAVDAATGGEGQGAPAYYMINCAHPSHFEARLDQGDARLRRVRGLRANASTRSHAELDAAPDLDAGDPHALGHAYRRLVERHPQIAVLGGCCGTDHRHVEEIGAACTRAAA
jgi:homocysteine S-methyltransferase